MSMCLYVRNVCLLSNQKCKRTFFRKIRLIIVIILYINRTKTQTEKKKTSVARAQSKRPVYLAPVVRNVLDAHVPNASLLKNNHTSSNEPK